MAYANIEDRRAHDKWYNEHKRDKEARRDALRRWRQLNPERNKELNRLSDERDPERVQARRARRYARDKSKVERQFSERLDIRLRALFATAKSRAKREGKDFTVSFEEIEWPEFCPVLGIRINYSVKGGRRGDDSPSLDRTRPELHYTAGNVVVMSWRANRIKYDSTIDELEKLLVYMRKVRRN